MRSLHELIDEHDPAMPLIREWLAGADNACELLPPAPDRGEALVQIQVTTHSTMGALIYETGGLLVDHGWLRFLGSGHPRLTRSLPGWNAGRSNGYLLVADDAASGFFAINGGGLGADVGAIYYWPPDNLEWESLEVGYGDFLQWSLTSKLADFCASLRWPSWRDDVGALPGDRCFSFYPFLWTREGSLEESHREQVPVAEAFDLKLDTLRQLSPESGL